jgi:hypothetical protein
LPAVCVPVIVGICVLASLWHPLVTHEFAGLKDDALSAVVFGAASGLILSVVFWLRWYLCFYRPGSCRKPGGAGETVQQENGG